MERGEGPLGNIIEVFSLVRYEWIDIHNWASVSLIIIILLHIFFHWEWIVAATFRLKNNIKKDIKKVVERYYIFGLLSILFSLEGVSGFVIWLILPRGSLDYLDMINGAGQIFWGLQRNIWVDIHAWIAVSIVSLIIIHLILNWKWISSVSRRIYISVLSSHKEN